MHFSVEVEVETTNVGKTNSYREVEELGGIMWDDLHCRALEVTSGPKKGEVEGLCLP